MTLTMFPMIFGMPGELGPVDYADKDAELVAGSTVEQGQSMLVTLVRQINRLVIVYGLNIDLEKTASFQPHIERLSTSKTFISTETESLQVVSAYRTVFEPAVIVIAVALLMKECRTIYNRKGEDSMEVLAREEQEYTVDRGNFLVKTHHEVDEQRDCLGLWFNGRPGEIDCFRTNLLSGYEGFQFYVYKIGKPLSSDCVVCNGVPFFLVKGVMKFSTNFIHIEKSDQMELYYTLSSGSSPYELV